MKTKVSTMIPGKNPVKLGQRHKFRLTDGRRIVMVIEEIDLLRSPGNTWISGTAVHFTGVDVSYPPDPVKPEETIQ